VKQKGGVEGIIALVILVGLVIALIIGAVLPIAREGKAMGDAGTTRLEGLGSAIAGS